MKIKITKSLLLFVAVFFTLLSAGAQNMSINIGTLNSGLVNVGGTVQLRVDVNNTDPTASTLVANKARPQISVPLAICNIAATGHTLPTGWTITSNSGTTIRITNTSDPIPAGETRTAFIAIQGNVIGGPSPISANLTFVGAAPNGDLAADNAATSSIEVSTVTPIKLTNFQARLDNCKPTLNWITESEINSDRFEIERATQNPTDWFKVGNTTAQGNSAVRNKYIFSDVTVSASTQKVFYRLKMIDKDGQYKYSPIVPVFINCKTMQINTYPNPVQTGLLNVNIITINNEKTEAVLMSAAGQVVLKMNLKNGLNTVNVSNIANGEYLLKVNAINSVSKVLIQNKK